MQQPLAPLWLKNTMPYWDGLSSNDRSTREHLSILRMRNLNQECSLEALSLISHELSDPSFLLVLIYLTRRYFWRPMASSRRDQRYSTWILGP
jgi:hypothetical protein